MTPWEMFVEALGYLFLGDFAALIFGIAYLLHRDRKERRQVEQLEAMYAREGE